MRTHPMVTASTSAAQRMGGKNISPKGLKKSPKRLSRVKVLWNNFRSDSLGRFIWDAAGGSE